MSRVHSRTVAWASLLACLAAAGCSSPSIVGEWHGEGEAKAYSLTILSDGTGDASQQGQPTKAIKWKRVNDKFEIAIVGTEGALEATLRENETLALFAPHSPDLGLLILKRK